MLDFNFNPISKNKGSAIFIHIAKKHYEVTEGCAEIGKKDFKKILKIIIKLIQL